MAESNEDVVGRFIKNGRLVIMPSKRSKLLLVLDHIAQDFELGHTYPEAEVNESCSATTTTTPPCAATSSTRAS